MLELVGHYYSQKAGQVVGEAGGRIEPGRWLEDRAGPQLGQEMGTPEIFEPE